MPALQVENLKKSFGRNQVLKGISFRMEKGEVLSVIGSSGSGKTTLLRCLNFLETPGAGRITVNGEVLFDSDTVEGMTGVHQFREKRLHFGMVFQSFNLFPQYTAFENITLASKLAAREKLKKHGEDYERETPKEALERIDRKAAELLETVGLSDKRDAYPYQLSGGQQQRVAIARALILSPDILCFDEPTSALDPELTGEVLKVIKGLKSFDRSMIIVTHEIDFARGVSDKVIFMSEGVIAEEGPPEEVIDRPKSERTRAFLARFHE